MQATTLQWFMWILLLILLCYGYERWTCPPTVLHTSLSTIAVSAPSPSSCLACPPPCINTTIIVNHTIVEHHTMIETRLLSIQDAPKCEHSPLDIAPIRLQSEGLPDLTFLWVNGPENRQAMQDWFNSREKYGIALLRHTFRKRDPAVDAFIDIGSHQGLFMHVAGASGFQAIGFDMQWLCVRLGRCGALINGFLRHQLHFVYVSPTAENRSVMADSDTCRGGAQAVDAPAAGHSRIAVYPMHAGKWLKLQGTRIAAVKIDTEGYEPFILETLDPIMASIDTIIFEISPHSWSTFGLSFDDAINRINRMWTVHGFFGVHLPEGNVAFDVCHPAEAFIYRDVVKFRQFMMATLEQKIFINLALKRVGMSMC